MSTAQDNLHKFWAHFNAVLMNRKMLPQDKIPRLLQLQSQLDVLPNEQSKHLFKLQSNLILGDCYVSTHQKYLLTPIVEECKQLLLKVEEWDFATQPKIVWGQLGSKLDGYYCDLVTICLAKNHQRDVAYCYKQISRIWDKIGDELRCVRALALCNVALAKIPGEFAFSREQLLEQFPNRATIINQTFDGARCLKSDPVEQSQKYIDAYDEAERIIQGLIEQQGRLARCPDQYWSIKREVLEFHFGIEWKSPRIMNPTVRF